MQSVQCLTFLRYFFCTFDIAHACARRVLFPALRWHLGRPSVFRRHPEVFSYPYSIVVFSSSPTWVTYIPLKTCKTYNKTLGPSSPSAFEGGTGLGG